jgi:hypothetical protein
LKSETFYDWEQQGAIVLWLNTLTARGVVETETMTVKREKKGAADAAPGWVSD